jgi:hypothetical protein
MQGRKPELFVLKKRDQLALQDLLRDGHVSQRIARRACILSCRAGGQGVLPAADKVDQNPSTVWRACEQYRQCGLEAALYDAPCSGRPRIFLRRY